MNTMSLKRERHKIIFYYKLKYGTKYVLLIREYSTK